MGQASFPIPWKRGLTRFLRVGRREGATLPQGEDRGVDGQLEQKRRKEPADHRSGDPLHHVGSGAGRPHHGQPIDTPGAAREAEPFEPPPGDAVPPNSGRLTAVPLRITSYNVCYTKLLRDLHSPDFNYDHWLWQKSSGIQQALLDNYNEIGQIKP